MLSGPHALLTPIIPIIVLTFHQWADERKDAVDVPSLSDKLNRGLASASFFLATTKIQQYILNSSCGHYIKGK